MSAIKDVEQAYILLEIELMSYCICLYVVIGGICSMLSVESVCW